MHRTRRGLAALAAIAVTALALTGCILPPPLPGEPTTPGGPSQASEPLWSPTGEAVAPELEPYYGQDVDWSDCGANWCGTVTAPMNWDDPSADTIELALTVAPATGERQGAIFYNPGGPGASGVEYVQDFADYLLHPDVREHYDLVGFDPRGVGASTPISCYDDPQELYDWLWEIPQGPAPEPLSDADLQLQLESAQWFADAGIETAWHENLTRSEQAADAREDISLAVMATGGVH